MPDFTDAIATAVEKYDWVTSIDYDYDELRDHHYVRINTTYNEGNQYFIVPFLLDSSVYDQPKVLDAVIENCVRWVADKKDTERI